MSQIIQLDRLDVTRLAADYSAAIRGALTDNQLAKVQAGEAVPDDYIDTSEMVVEGVLLQKPHAESIADYGDEMQLAEERARAADYRLSRILIACEFTGSVRDQLAAMGHSVMSCDLLETETPGAHYQGNVLDVINDGWHQMVAHPPCTYLCSSALWRGQPDKHGRWSKGRSKDRQRLSDEALDFVRELDAAPIPQKVIENPVGRVGSCIRPATQYVQPYMLGDDASKNTGLWMTGLDAMPVLPEDQWVKPRQVMYKGKLRNRWANQSPCGADATAPGPDRWKIRSKTFPGIAQGLAHLLTGTTNPLLSQPAETLPMGQLSLAF